MLIALLHTLKMNNLGAALINFFGRKALYQISEGFLIE